jgi:hypothetical protein
MYYVVNTTIYIQSNYLFTFYFLFPESAIKSKFLLCRPISDQFVSPPPQLWGRSTERTGILAGAGI